MSLLALRAGGVIYTLSSPPHNAYYVAERYFFAVNSLTYDSSCHIISCVGADQSLGSSYQEVRLHLSESWATRRRWHPSATNYWLRSMIPKRLTLRHKFTPCTRPEHVEEDRSTARPLAVDQHNMAGLRLPSCQNVKRVVEWLVIHRTAELCRSAGAREPADAPTDGPGDRNKITGTAIDRPAPVDLITS